jgi:hypothetical protein
MRNGASIIVVGSEEYIVTPYVLQRNCGENATCADPPETPLRIAPWQWVMTVLCVLSGMYGSFPIRDSAHLKITFW